MKPENGQMLLARIYSIIFLLFAVSFTANAQIIGYRLALNSSVFMNELGDPEVPHPDVLLATPTIHTKKFKPQPTVGVEGEILFQVSPMSHFGIELEYSKIKGFNNTPPVYNYYLTPYYKDFQTGGEFITSPIAFQTAMFNVAANWKYFFFEKSPLKPFFKLTGVVSFIGTDFSIKNSEDATELDSEILYSRGTSNSEQKKLPVFHLGGGIGFDYEIDDRWSIQVDGTLTAINTDLMNGVPNFTYVVEGEKAMLNYNKCWSLTTQISAGIVYYIEVGGQRGGRGKSNPSLPFYRKKM